MNDDSDQGLTNIYNQYAGERIFIIGNGPSLNETPLNRLESEYTFALNRINYIYDEIEWRPKFYLFAKSTMNKEEKEFVEENIKAGCICFLNNKYRGYFGDGNNIYYIKRKKLSADPLTIVGASRSDIDQVETNQLLNVWAEDITQGVYKQHSMFPIFQIVSYLGFDEIYLLGCDLGFDVQKPYVFFESGIDPADHTEKKEFLTASIRERKLIRSTINGMIYKLMLTRPVDYALRRWTTLYEDSSHFTESYDGKIRFKDVNEEISNAHRVAKRILNDQGVAVYNATLGGELEVYPRVDIDKVINGS